MNTKLIVVMSAVLVLSSVASATYSSSRTVVVPGTVSVAGAGTFGVAVCERISAAGGGSPVQCEDTGFSAFFDDMGCLSAPANGGFIDPSPHSTNPYDLDDCPAGGVHNFVSGSCSASAVFTPTTTTPGFTMLCGNDRDDDTFITDSDTSGSSDTTAEAPGSGSCRDASGYDPVAEDGCFDDEFVGTSTTTGSTGNVGFCFTRDRETYAATHPDAADSAGGDHDGYTVFIGVNVPDLNGAVGTVTVNMDATSSNTACTRSGHSDNVYHDVGNPTPPVDPVPGCPDDLIGFVLCIVGMVPVVGPIVVGAVGTVITTVNGACQLAIQSDCL